jgi:hypothetical protein
MMTSGGISINGPMARRVMKRYHGRNRAAKTVARALSVVSSPIELSSRLRRVEFAKNWANVDPGSFDDVYGYYDENGRRRKGVAHKVVAQAETGARWAGDIHDFLSRRRAENSAKVGQFKITENSPNTARISVGPDQRERRKKYMWERVGVQRNLAIGGIALASVLGAKVHRGISAETGSFSAGLKNLFGRAKHGIKGVVGKTIGAKPLDPFVAHEGPVQWAQKQADLLKRQTEEQTQKQAKRVANKLTKYPHGYDLVPAHASTKTPGMEVPFGHAEAGDPIMKTGKKGPYKKKMKVARSVPGQAGVGNRIVDLKQAS